MKKGYVMCLVTGLAIGGCFTARGSQIISAYRNDEVRITLNDVEQTFRDESTGELMYPLTYNNRTYLPLRNVANLAGLNVGYDDATKTAKLTTKDYTPSVQTATTGTYLKMAQDMYNKINENMTQADVVNAIEQPTNIINGNDVKYEYITKKGNDDVRLLQIYFNSNGIVRDVQIILTNGIWNEVSLAQEINTPIEDLTPLVARLEKGMSFENVVNILGNGYFEYSKSFSSFSGKSVQYKWVDKKDQYCTPSFYDSKLNFVPTVIKGW